MQAKSRGESQEDKQGVTDKVAVRRGRHVLRPAYCMGGLEAPPLLVLLTETEAGDEASVILLGGGYLPIFQTVTHFSLNMGSNDLLSL